MGGTASTTYIADDAVVFIEDSDGVEVTTGATLKAWSDTTSNNFGTTGAVLTKTVSGLNTAKVILISNTSATANGVGSTDYGYIISTPYLTSVDGDTYATYSIWTGSETLTVYDDSASTTNVVKYDVISYAVVSGNYITDAIDITDYALISGTSTKVGALVAVTGYNGDDVVVMDAAGNEVSGLIDSDDTTVMYINSKDLVGVSGGEIAVAGTMPSGAYILNAYYYDADGFTDGTPDLIVYDVNNDLDNKSNTDGVGITGYTVTVPSATIEYQR